MTPNGLIYLYMNCEQLCNPNNPCFSRFSLDLLKCGATLLTWELMKQTCLFCLHRPAQVVCEWMNHHSGVIWILMRCWGLHFQKIYWMVDSTFFFLVWSKWFYQYSNHRVQTSEQYKLKLNGCNFILLSYVSQNIYIYITVWIIKFMFAIISWEAFYSMKSNCTVRSGPPEAFKCQQLPVDWTWITPPVTFVHQRT